MFGIESRGELVGVCGLTNISWVNRTAEVSIYVVPECQSEGIGLKTLRCLRNVAFREFHLHRLWAEIFAFNDRSIELFERAGFCQEGRMEDHVFKNGAYHDSLIYGLVVKDAQD
jgi:RimJ/RimL family protein N-acetyltransferase